MSAPVNHNEARVGQVTREAFSETQWNYSILTSPNHKSRQTNRLKAWCITNKVLGVYQTCCLGESLSNFPACIVSCVLRRQKYCRKAEGEPPPKWRPERFDEEWEVLWVGHSV